MTVAAEIRMARETPSSRQRIASSIAPSRHDGLGRWNDPFVPREQDTRLKARRLVRATASISFNSLRCETSAMP
jgi:hypothetical protein